MTITALRRPGPVAASNLAGMGAAIAVLMAARALGARDARVLHYAHSGEVSGDNACVVGYVAAAVGTFDAA